MALMNPKVVGPVSELTASIRVQGQLPGATVEVVSTTPTLHVVAKGVVASSDERVALLGGTPLKTSDLLFARQELSGESSPGPEGDLGIGVQPKPTSAAGLGHVGYVSHLYECGQHVWVSGAIPGTTVELVAGNQVLGSDIADEGDARFGLSHGLPGQTPIGAHQVAPGLPNGPDTDRTADPLPGRRGQGLPPPTIDPPIRGCDPAVHVSGVFDGATVTIRRASGGTDVAGFDRGDLWFVLGDPLKEGDELEVRQDVERTCERPGVFSAPFLVGPLKPVETPVVQGPLCKGASIVRVSGLRPGATVHLAANGTVFDGKAPDGQTWLDCGVPPLKSDAVRATQEVCGVVSAPSPSVHVDAHEAGVPAATVVGPLFACARSVSVAKVHAGATVQIFARNATSDAPISAQVLLFESNGTIPVAPYLSEGDLVYAKQWACSDVAVRSATEPVLAHPQPAPVEILGPIFDGDGTVDVRHAIPGALVEVHVLRREEGAPVFAGSGVADTLHPVTPVQLSFRLSAGDRVFAGQSICDEVASTGDGVPVEEAPRFGPRPFYVFGHNPNTIKDVEKALAAGANAIEPDLNVFEDPPDQISVSHSEGDPGDPTLVEYLQQLHQVAAAHPALALVVFDCKEKVATADHGFEILDAVRNHLTFDNDLNIVISVGKIADGAIFDRIRGLLGPREGLMIDAEDDPVGVADYFSSRGVDHQCYGNGISFANSVIGPYYRYTLERACELTAQANRPKFVYVWTVNDDDEMREYIRIGVDGIISDDVAKLKAITGEAEFASLIRIAQRIDDPFVPADFAYGLIVHTGDKWMAGTDAHVTFTLTGTLGSVSKRVDTQLIKRMERDDWNFVTIPSSDLGDLLTITVQRDNHGNGPDWFLDQIRVRSFRFGASKTAVFDRWIDTTSAFTKTLV